jgi:hypothetical protein
LTNNAPAITPAPAARRSSCLSKGFLCSLHILPSGAVSARMPIQDTHCPRGVCERAPKGLESRLGRIRPGNKSRAEGSQDARSYLNSWREGLIIQNGVLAEITPSSVAPPNHPWRSPPTDPLRPTHERNTHSRGQLQRDVRRIRPADMTHTLGFKSTTVAVPEMLPYLQDDR